MSTLRAIANVGVGQGDKSQKAFGMPVNVHQDSNLPANDQEILRSEGNDSVQFNNKERKVSRSGEVETSEIETDGIETGEIEKSVAPGENDKIDSLKKEIQELKSRFGVDYGRQFPGAEKGISGKDWDYDALLKMITDKCNSERESFLKSKESKGVNELLDAMGGLKDDFLSRVSFFTPVPGKMYPQGDLIYFGCGVSVNPKPSDFSPGIPLSVVEGMFHGFELLFFDTRKTVSTHSIAGAGSGDPIPLLTRFF